MDCIPQKLMANKMCYSLARDIWLLVCFSATAFYLLKQKTYLNATMHHLSRGWFYECIIRSTAPWVSVFVTKIDMEGRMTMIALKNHLDICCPNSQPSSPPHPQHTLLLVGKGVVDKRDLSPVSRLSLALAQHPNKHATESKTGQNNAAHT